MPLPLPISPRSSGSVSEEGFPCPRHSLPQAVSGAAGTIAGRQAPGGQSSAWRSRFSEFSKQHGGAKDQEEF